MVTSFSASKVRPIILLRLQQLEREGYRDNQYRNNYRHNTSRRDGYDPTPTLTPMQILSAKCRLSDRSIYRILHVNKWVKTETADKLAIGLGYHIGDIWPEYFDD